mmetsp:Transcript_3754/g.9840  ORF Transcript_3754/g.9840 Transcript_3754/m.9840 type:complete len:101 (+) Transcript_3754:2088-2390(+)
MTRKAIGSCPLVEARSRGIKLRTDASLTASACIAFECVGCQIYGVTSVEVICILSPLVLVAACSFDLRTILCNAILHRKSANGAPLIDNDFLLINSFNTI